jgi:LPPG:FO 2-phospho-L-lactate transferase
MSGLGNRIVALCGGIGGAKLALGLYHALGPDRLTVVVNTGDDFEHLGLAISPDLDTVLYTLGGLADPERGWGRADESWQFMEALRQLGGETWFQLGDRDLAMHVERTSWLRAGKNLSTFAAKVAKSFDVDAQILPMTDAAVHTIVETDEGALPFQHYFVRRRCEPRVRAIRFAGVENARPPSGLLDLIAGSSLQAIVICPSNPYLSVDPILAVPEIASALANAQAPVLAVSPIIGGHAVKGPLAKIMMELGLEVTNKSIVDHYGRLIDGLVVDESDGTESARLEVPVLSTRTLMRDLEDRKRLAGEVLGFAEKLERWPDSKPSRRRR